MASEERGILLVGGPDAGKTNFLTGFWLALINEIGDLRVSDTPQDISYVENALKHLLSGRFAPRSSMDDGSLEFKASIEVVRGAQSGSSAQILVPDTLGELWSKAVDTREIDQQWMDLMRHCNGAVLFVRINSEQLREPLDWVTAAALMSSGLEDGKDAGLPTQVFLCELMRFLEVTLRDSPDGRRPRVAVIVTAWDLLDAERGSQTPRKFLEDEFPMFAGRIEDTARLEIEVFGSLCANIA